MNTSSSLRIVEEEIEYLAQIYMKLRTAKVFVNRWKTFEDLVNDYKDNGYLRNIKGGAYGNKI